MPKPEGMREVEGCWVSLKQEEFEIALTEVFVNRRQKVKGRRVIVPGFEEFSLFLHRAYNRTTLRWNVSEVITGHAAVGYRHTQPEAIAAVKARFESRTPAQLDETRQLIAAAKGDQRCLSISI